MEENNKRIIQNTLFLYIRMFITMCISFFTTRIVLEKLGVSDYGIYNIVGGFISMFTLLNSILQTGTRRFLALNLGKGEKVLIKNTFSTAFVIHLLIAFAVLFLAETFGLWFLNNNLNIAANRLEAANWVYQLSLVSVLLSITQTPYTAAVTAHEKFNIYAYLSIFDVIAKLIVIYLLVFISGDKLIIYASLQLATNIINITLYQFYCTKNFYECKFSLRIDKPLFKSMLHFSGWSTIGHFSAIFNSQGISVLLNIFFNTTINAARGLANTVIFTIGQFVDGFITASVPQLVKYYGTGEKEKFKDLIFNISQYTLFLLSIIAIPVMIEIDFVLKLWLTEVPEYTGTFIKISILISIISYSNKMIDQGIVAIGKMKQLALWTSSIYLLDFPLTYLVLKLGCSPSSAYIVSIIPVFIGFYTNLYILSKYAQFPAKEYFFSVFLKNLVLMILSAIIPLTVHIIIPNNDFFRFFIVCFLSVICSISIIYTWGLGNNAKQMVNKKLKVFFKI